jgi:uncharacterized membrane protein
METDKILLFYLTVPPLLFILGILIVELDLFKRLNMLIIILLAAIAELFERRDKKYQKAMKEIKGTQHVRL